MNVGHIIQSQDRDLDPRTLKARLVVLLARSSFQMFLALFLGIFIPHFIRGGDFSSISEMITSSNPTFLSQAIAILLGFAVFRKMAALPGLQQISSVLPAFSLAFGVVAAFYFGLRYDFSRNSFLISFAVVCGLLMGFCYIINRLHPPVIGVVPGGRANALFEQKKIRWITLPSVEVAASHPNLAIAVDLRSDSLSPEWESFVAKEVVRGRYIYNAKQLSESLTGRVRLEHLSENQAGHLAPDAIYAPIKRYFEFVGSLIAIILLAPVLLLTVLIIRLDTPGPALFKQQRMGFQGRNFTVYKFRSMFMTHSPKDENAEENKPGHDDHRITRIGRFIRKTRIDELPQLFNILKGEMSLIGPRPETLELSTWYETEIPFYRYRHIVRPGITGWAQVHQGHVVGVADADMKLQYDMYYIKHFSFWLDFLIALQTIRVILTGQGAR